MSRVPTKRTMLGIERLCRQCGEWWPLDGEFWFFDKRHRTTVMGPCRACWSDRNREYHAARRAAA